MISLLLFFFLFDKIRDFVLLSFLSVNSFYVLCTALVIAYQICFDSEFIRFWKFSKILIKVYARQIKFVYFLAIDTKNFFSFLT